MARRLSEDSLLALVDALGEDRWHSGETLAAAAGITRAALAKRVEHLREWGLSVTTQPGLGYRLDPPLQRLSVDAIIAAWPSGAPRPRNLHVLPRTDSTNQQLLQADGADDPQILLAEMQTAGRGRRGREWRSPFGANLYASLSWTFPAWPAQLGTLPLACGVACARALRAFDIPVLLKWPNDVRIGDRKLAGILVEQRGEAGGACRVVVGVGLNYAMDPLQAEGIAQPWTSLRNECARLQRELPPRNAVAARLLAALCSALQDYAYAGFEPFRADWAAWDETAGRPVRVLQGEHVIEGRACGIDASGALLLDTAEGRKPMLAGDVSLRLADAAP